MIKKERHVLVVFPHPDDEAFGVSGTISSYREMGVPVTYACLTLGEMGRNLGNPPFANRETLPQIRKEELQKACEAMGLDDLRMMGFRDKTVEFEDDEKMVKLVADLIEETNPSLVISFYPGLLSIPITMRLRVQLCVRSEECRKQNVLHFIHSPLRTIQLKYLANPISFTILQQMLIKKLQRLKAHASQTVWMMKEMEIKLAAQDPEALKWLNYERFYTYKWDQDFE